MKEIISNTSIPSPISKSPVPQKSTAKTGFIIEHITKEELSSVPNYAKGRVSLEKVNEAINEINKIIHIKYTLLETPFHQLTEAQVAKVKEHRNLQSKEIENQFFFIESDLKGTKVGMDATSKSILQILKHIGKLKAIGKLFVVQN